MAAPQRPGDKSPYHYQNSSNPRQTAPYSRPPVNAISPNVSTRPTLSGGSQPPLSSGTSGRPSRYNPSASGRPYTSVGGLSVKPRSGSRYNPEPGFTISGQSSGTGMLDSRRFSNGPHSSATSSRYNLQHSSGNPKPNHHGYYNPPYNRRRPSSVSDGYESGPHSYSARSKWRESFPNSNSLDYEGYNAGVSGNSTNISSSKALPSAYINRYHNNSQPFSSRYSHNKDERSYNESSSAYHNSDTRFADNQHSLGSSLINSVPQTTRKIEAKVASEHERIDLKKQKLSEDRMKYEKNLNDETTDNTRDDTRDDMPTVESIGLSDNEIDDNNSADAPGDFAKIKAGPVSNKLEEPPTIDEIQQQPPLTKPLLDQDKVTPAIKAESDAKENITPSNHLPLPEKQRPMTGYSKPLEDVGGCIFPMTEPEMKLWELKNRDRNQIIKCQRYLLKNPIISFKEYPFMSQNILIHEQAIKPVLLKSLSKLKNYERLRKLQLKKEFLDLDHKWVNSCQRLQEISKEVKKEEVAEKSADLQRAESERSREKEEQDQHNRAGSRRRNRADFVDDTEIESVLLQIDPDYKHHQFAARIPAMIIDPIQKLAVKFKDVNNLVTNKDAWATRVRKDGIDTFTPGEHEAFVEAYLLYPKKFGRISQYMGGLRKPEECVLHYYRTKKETNYKQLLIDKNKKRKINTGRKRKEKERERLSPEASLENNVQDLEVMAEKNEVNLTEAEKPVDETEYEEGDQSVDSRGAEVQFSENAVKSDFEETVPSISKAAIDLIEHDSQPGQETEPEIETRVDTAQLAVAVAQSATDVAGDTPPIDPEQDVKVNKRKIQEMEEVTNDLPNLQPIAPALVSEAKENSRMEDAQTSLNSEEIEKGQQSKKRSKHNDGFHKSSYWSVKETNLFPELLKEFGTQWALISEKLGTKSTTMVRNYFQRNADQMGWQSLVEGLNAGQSTEKNLEKETSATMVEAQHDVMPLQQIPSMPSQQIPSVSIFNQSNRDATTPTQVPTQTTSESFSQQSTPKGLPPPRLPSIQLHTDSVGAEKQTVVTQETTADQGSGPSVHFAPEVSATSIVHSINQSSGPSSATSSQTGIGSRRSSIKSLLNNDPTEFHNPPIRQPEAKELPSNSRNEISGANVIVQELQSLQYTSPPADGPFVTSSTRPAPKKPGFLSAILNAATSPASQAPQGPPRVSINKFPEPSTDLHSVQRPILPPVSAHSNISRASISANSSHTVPTRPPEFNFANDPLAALAAVASAPEALASLVPPDGGALHNSSSRQQ
ncbi:LANO_0G03466g1_1 [Lachancea nothofagi CBS 11611]|uniref:LANO_0G03466g1_1 n=1 Tax=Lachancea nothofagi CBS 11611 TaxID=1266666 RepID=A0A1G4KFW1_9SACH|nr:LANO_0G03466g1_1 [Lachancea nothofagi CBS 11611]